MAGEERGVSRPAGGHPYNGAAGDGISGREVWQLVALTAVGAALRLYRLGDESFWNDEFASMEDALALGPDILLEQLGVGRPLYYLLLRPWIEIFGTAEIGMRSLSVVLGAATIPLLYLLGRVTYGRTTAAYGTLLLVVSRYHVRWSQDARMYALLALLTTASYLAFVHFLRQKDRRRATQYVLVTGLMLYTHVYSGFVILAQTLHLVAVRWLPERHHRRIDQRRAIATLGGVGIVALPVTVEVGRTMLGLRGGESAPVSWLGEPGMYELATIPVQQIVRTYDPFLPLTLLPIVSGLIAIGLLWGDRGREWGLMFGLCCGSVFLLPFVFSVLVHPVYTLRYTMPAAPALLLLTGRGIEVAHEALEAAFIQRVFTVGLVLVLLFPLLGYYEEPQRAQWRTTAEQIEEDGGPDDIVLVTPEYTRRNLVYYLNEGHPTVIAVDGTEDTDLARDSAIEADSIWLVVSQNTDEGDLQAMRSAMEDVGLARPGSDEPGDIVSASAPDVRNFRRIKLVRYPTVDRETTEARTDR